MSPDFMCIGAQKAGTSWLDRQLSQHPDLWLPPLKEIHYYDTPHFLLALLLFSRYGRLRIMMRSCLERGQSKSQNRAWFWRYYFMPRTESWYLSLFDPEPGQIAGEITPACRKLAQATIAGIKERFPELKIIYQLRNPMQRMWSQAAMDLGRYGQLGQANKLEAEILEFLLSPEQLAHSSYYSNYQRWRRFFPEE